MKCWIIFLVLQLHFDCAHGGKCPCVIRPSPCTLYQTFDNCRLADNGGCLISHDIRNATECLNLLNASDHNGVEWRGSRSECRTCACLDPKIRFVKANENATVIKKTCQIQETVELVVLKPLYIVPCICNNNNTFKNKTEKEILEYLVNETRIDTKNTSAALDKLRSRSDSRMSSQIIGNVAVVILAVIVGLVLFTDILSLCKKKHFVGSDKGKRSPKKDKKKRSKETDTMKLSCRTDEINLSCGTNKMYPSSGTDKIKQRIVFASDYDGVNHLLKTGNYGNR